MNNTPACSGATVRFQPMGPGAVEAVRQLEQAALKMAQTHIPTDHVFHGGMYARTIKIPAGVVLTGALIKIPTLLIISGDALVYGADGGHTARFTGYRVCLGMEGRKQAFFALEDTFLTMIFPTGADTIDEAERQFTDEYELLASRRGA